MCVQVGVLFLWDCQSGCVCVNESNYRMHITWKLLRLWPWLQSSPVQTAAKQPHLVFLSPCCAFNFSLSKTLWWVFFLKWWFCLCYPFSKDCFLLTRTLVYFIKDIIYHLCLSPSVPSTLTRFLFIYSFINTIYPVYQDVTWEITKLTREEKCLWRRNLVLHQLSFKAFQMLLWYRFDDQALSSQLVKSEQQQLQFRNFQLVGL